MPLILWSGGCDSTLLLTHALNLMKQDHNQPPIPGQPYTPPGQYDVRTISILHPNVIARNEQKQARKNIIKELNKQGHHWPHTDIIITHQHYTKTHIDAQPAPPDTKGIIQPNIWIPTAAQYLLPNEHLDVGYIKTDDVMYYLTTIKSAFDQLQWITGRTGTLRTPLDCHNKADVLEQLTQTGLHTHTWHCENPTYNTKNSKDLGTPCNQCNPCITHNTAQWQIKTYRTTISKPIPQNIAIKPKKKTKPRNQ